MEAVREVRGEVVSRAAPSGDGAWCDRLLALPMPTVLYHATTPKKYGRMLATGHILPPVRGFTTEAGARRWFGEIHGHRPVILRAHLSGPAYPLPDHHNEDGWAFWSPASAFVDRIIRVVPPDGSEVRVYLWKTRSGWAWNGERKGGILFHTEVDAVASACDALGAYLVEKSDDFEVPA